MNKRDLFRRPYARRRLAYTKKDSCSSLSSMNSTTAATNNSHAKRKTWFGLFAKALFPRLLFLLHGLLCIYLIVKQEENDKYWYLTFCLGLLFIEGIFNVIVRHGREFHWFCPSAFLYCVVLITTMVFLREGQIKCLTDTSYCLRKLPGNDLIIRIFNDWTYSKRADIIEQTGLLVLIVGRWLLPQGSISKDQFCQILLIYIGTAADIVEFSEIYKDDDVQKLSKDTVTVLHGCMVVWALSVVQFSMTIALPEEGLKVEEEEEEESEDQFEQMSYFRNAKLQNKVAPMSYMQYKSLLREGMNGNGGGKDNPATLMTRRSNRNGAATFQQKYPTWFGGLDSNTTPSLRSKPAGLEPITDSPHLRRTESTSLQTINQMNSNGSMTQRSDTLSSINTARSKKISLPHGGRVPMNIGSPPPSTKRTIGSPMSARVKKSSTTSSSRGFVIDKGVAKESGNSSRRNNFSSDNTAPDINKWNRLLERVPWSKKRFRNEDKLQRRDSTKEDNSLGIGKNEVKGCFYQYLDLIAILLPVCMQDGPFFILRLVLVAHYNLVTDMTVILLTKNALVIIVNIYRILIIYCSEPPKELNDEESSRVRAAMDTNQKLSGRKSFKAKRASIAVQALSRMQVQLFGKQDESVLRQTRQDESQANDFP